MVTAYSQSAHGLGEAFVGFCPRRRADAVADAVLDMALQNDLSTAVQSRLGRVDLGENILAGHVFIHHAVDGLYLPDDFFQMPMQIVCIHALLHGLHLHTVRGIC